MENIKHTVLVCDDDRDIVNALEIYLSSENYNVLKAGNGNEALNIIRNNDVQLILMDIMMPEKDGLTAVKEIRENYNMPIIFTTAKSEDHDIILGLNLGADDYITKPFNPVELLARVRSQLRRYTRFGAAVSDKNLLTINGIEIDDDAKIVRANGDEISLTPKEYDILLLLMKNAGKVFSPADIYEKVWNDRAIGQEGTIAVHIRHLREKIEITPTEPRYIKVVWGQGYKFEK